MSCLDSHYGALIFVLLDNLAACLNFIRKVFFYHLPHYHFQFIFIHHKCVAKNDNAFVFCREGIGYQFRASDDGKAYPVVLSNVVQFVPFLRAMKIDQIVYDYIIEGVSQKMLTQHLRQMEADGLVHRKVYPEVPPRVEYSLTHLGKSLKPVLESMSSWGLEYLKSRSGEEFSACEISC